MRLKVFRFDPLKKRKWYDTFELEHREGMTVLEALFQVQNRFDGTLSFRYSCRGAVCGSCAMLINKVPRLACRTQVMALIEANEGPLIKDYPALHGEGGEGTYDASTEILVEPLPHLPVLKDLIVDMDRFFQSYRKIGPVFRPADQDPAKERTMDPGAVRELELYTNCILCAACYASCPVNGEDPDYLGPAALAKLYRFHIDPREAKDDERLHIANYPSGWWDCQFHTNCKKVCPKGVPPNLAIGKARGILKKKGKVPPGHEAK